jgi:hypothetical protein
MPITNHSVFSPGARSAARFSVASGGPARSLPQTRWIAWARALGARWGHGFERNDRLALTFLRPLAVARHLRERWLLKSQRFYPKINLSVQVFLRATGPVVFERGNSRNSVLVGRRLQAGQRVQSRESGIEPSLAAGVEYSGYGATDREPGTPGRTEVMSPLERVLARSESLIDTREAAGSVRVEAILERMTLRSERIESKFSISAMPITRSLSAQSIAHASTMSKASDRVEAPARFARVDALSQERVDRESGSEQNRRLGAESAINIEQITDRVIRQLDRRVVAARERMGRTF